MIRFLLVLWFVLSFLFWSIPLLIVEWIIGKFNPAVKTTSSLAIVNWAFRVCIWLSGTKVTILGKENIPTDTAVLYVGNHRSYFDILLTYVQVIRPTGYIAKQEMLRYPLLRDWMKNLHCLFLNRKDIKEGMKTIIAGVEKLKSGISICIFPEGTRNQTPDTFLPFHDGSFKMAERANCPVLPMTINNSSAVFEDQFPKIKPAHVIIEYGKPIYIHELAKEDQKQIGNYVKNIIRATYEKNRECIQFTILFFLSKSLQFQ